MVVALCMCVCVCVCVAYVCCYVGATVLRKHDTLLETCKAKKEIFWVQSLHTLCHRLMQVLAPKGDMVYCRGTFLG